jgi:very-short-patch-repair endonuclease
MTCLECKKELSYLDHRKAIELFDVELCEAHRARMERLMKSQHAPAEAIILYYALKKAGVKAMLSWWDGKKTVDLAVSRVKLNIEIDRGQESLSYEKAMEELGQAMHDYQDGFATLRIPHYLVKTDLKVTLESILGIIEALKPNLKVV